MLSFVCSRQHILCRLRWRWNEILRYQVCAVCAQPSLPIRTLSLRKGVHAYLKTLRGVKWALFVVLATNPFWNWPPCSLHLPTARSRRGNNNNNNNDNFNNNKSSVKLFLVLWTPPRPKFDCRLGLSVSCAWHMVT